MAGIFRRDTANSSFRDKEKEGKGKHGLTVKSARSFWEAQVRSSRVVQVKRGSAEQSVWAGLQNGDGNDSDGGASPYASRARSATVAGSRRMDAGSGSTSAPLTAGSVEDAEAAISRMVRELRNELDLMHEEDTDISLRLASLQGEVTAIEEKISQTHYGVYFNPGQSVLEPSYTESSGHTQSPKHQPALTDSDDSADDYLRARRDSLREQRVISALRFKRVNSYHGLQSARVVLKPMGPAESVDRLEWNKPHLWPSMGASISRSSSTSTRSSTSQSQSLSAETSLDSTVESAADPTYAVPQRSSLASFTVPSANTSLHSDIVPPAEPSALEADQCSASLPGDRQNADSASAKFVARKLGHAIPLHVNDDLQNRAVSGIHSDEILAMYMERESNLRSELGLLPQGGKTKSSSLSRSSSLAKSPTEPAKVKQAGFVRSGSFRRSTERIEGSIASSSSFRSSLRRRGDSTVGSVKDGAPSTARPSRHSASINTYI